MRWARSALWLEGAMVERVPITRGHHRQSCLLEGCQIAVEHSNHFIVPRHCQAATHKEI